MSFKAKTIAFGLVTTTLLVSFSYATNEIGCTQSPSSFSNCTSRYLYLYQDNNQNNLPDFSIVPKANYIYNTNPSNAYDLIQLMTGSNVQYYMSNPNMLYTTDSNGTLGVMDDTLFRLQSWVFEYKVPIRAISAFRYVHIEVPSLTGITNPTVGFKYNYVLKKAIGYNGTSTSDYRYRPVPSLDYFGEQLEKLSVTNNKKRSRSSEFSTSTCVNYNIQRCGDKKTSTHTGYYLNKTFYPVTSWVNTGFTPEVCDSTTETGAACTNGTAGCCNTTCSGFGSAFCGDKIINDGQTIEGHGPTYMSGDIEIIETCDLGPWSETTQEGNISDYKLSACAAYCENNPEPETLPEELG